MKQQAFVLFLLSLVAINHASSQRMHSPSPAKEKESIEILLSNETALDSLVDLAIQNSYYIEGFKAELDQQHENVKQERKKWLSTFRLGINFFSLSTTLNNQDQSVTRAGLLPNLGFTLSVDPEKFVNRGSYIRKAEMNVTRAESQVNHQRRMLRAEIINLYFQYIEALGIIELREAANQNQLEQYTLVEERFKKGESKLEDLLSTQAAVALASEALLKAQLSARKVKHQISLITTDSENHLSKQE